MTVGLLTTWFGVFLTRDGEVFAERIFPKDEKVIARNLSLRMQGKVLNEERTLAATVGDGVLVVYEPRLEKLGGYLSLERPDDVDCRHYGFEPSLLQNAYLLMAEGSAYGERAPGRDIVNLAKTREDLIFIRGLLHERLFSWSNECYPGFVSLGGWVSSMATGGVRDTAEEEGLDVKRFGATEAEGEALKLLASQYIEVTELLSRHETLLQREMEREAPNLSRLLGPLLAAKMVMLANGLERLAVSSSSKVQLLGAEKALFRHKRKGAKPPKHGILLQHPWVHGVGPKLRGRRARVLANKTVIAARADALTGNTLPDDFFKL